MAIPAALSCVPHTRGAAILPEDEYRGPRCALAKNAPDLKVILPPDWAIIIGFKVSDFDPDQIL
jgi:hypothetical protein